MTLAEDVRNMIKANQVVIVATADQAGAPHLAAARGLALPEDPDNAQVLFEEWFCIQTLKNIATNPKVALSLLDANGESGFQLIGIVEKITPTEMLDGLSPGEELRPTRIPQAKHRLQIKVEKVLALSTGPHSDDL